MVILNFDATQVEPDAPRDAIPAGRYDCIITKSVMKETSRGDGEMLELQLKVIRGAYQNWMLFDRLNLKNPNEQAVDIAQRTLSAICHAVGVMQPKDSSELHDKPLSVTVAVGEYNGNLKNDVKGYSKYLATAPAVPAGKPITNAQIKKPVPASPFNDDIPF